MEFKEITISKGVTISVGQFESIRCDASLKIALDEDDDTDVAFSTGYDMCDEQLNNQIKAAQSVIADKSVFKSDEETGTKKHSRRRK